MWRPGGKHRIAVRHGLCDLSGAPGCISNVPWHGGGWEVLGRMLEEQLEVCRGWLANVKGREAKRETRSCQYPRKGQNATREFGMFTYIQNSRHTSRRRAPSVATQEALGRLLACTETNRLYCRIFKK